MIFITDPFKESSGYSYAHEIGFREMRRNIGLSDSQFIYKVNVFDGEPGAVEEAIRDCIDDGANIIFATSWGYMETCEKLSGEFPSVIFAHASGNRYNETNFTNYFGKAYQAKYLSGLIAGLKTKTNRIGFVTPWGTENSETTGNLNAFAMGVEKANPHAKVFVNITYNWYDPMGETVAANTLIAGGCDIISQDVDSPAPQIEAQRFASQGVEVLGIGYNTDMSLDAPDVVLTSVIWKWGAFYTSFVKSVIDGTFNTTPYNGSLKDGIVDLSPLNRKFDWEPSVIQMLIEERLRIEYGLLDIFSGVMETNDGQHIGREEYSLSDEEIHSGIDWFYRNVVVLK